MKSFPVPGPLQGMGTPTFVQERIAMPHEIRETASATEDTQRRVLQKYGDWNIIE